MEAEALGDIDQTAIVTMRFEKDQVVVDRDGMDVRRDPG